MGAVESWDVWFCVCSAGDELPQELLCQFHWEQTRVTCGHLATAIWGIPAWSMPTLSLALHV